MPAKALAPSDLLRYDPTHRIIICLQCQYAVQKSALSSHLLRHKIYRGDRQRLLSAFEGLEVLDTEDVPLPDPSCPPVESLPITAGYRCTVVAECDFLSASDKRLRRHWSEAHGLNDVAKETSTLCRPAQLQAFFRGNKTKYFEVSASTEGNEMAALSPSQATSAVPRVSTIIDHHEKDNHHNDKDKHSPGSMLAQSVQTSPATITPPSILNFNLETFTYFHHFTTITILMLPPFREYSYWQAEVVDLALQRRGLMCGLLAIAAYHLASLAHDRASMMLHQERGGQLFAEFDRASEELSSGTGHEMEYTSATSENVDEIIKAVRQTRCVLSLLRWPLAKLDLNQGVVTQEPGDSFQLQSFLMILRSLAGVTPRHDRQAESIAESKTILEAGVLSHFGRPNEISDILHRLAELPYRIAEAVGKPDRIQDVFATMSAIADLVIYCDLTFRADDPRAAWHGMVMWVCNCSGDFNRMIMDNSPAALVVLAHWAAFLVNRAEACGCWFLSGLGEMAVMQTVGRLSVDDEGVRGLVHDLLS